MLMLVVGAIFLHGRCHVGATGLCFRGVNHGLPAGFRCFVAVQLGAGWPVLLPFAHSQHEKGKTKRRHVCQDSKTGDAEKKFECSRSDKEPFLRK